MTVVKVTGLDHIVLVVADVERSLAWYEDRFGMEPLRVDQWRRGEVPFPSLRVNDGIIIDLIPGPRAGENVDHFCLIVDTDELEPLVASGQFELVEGPGVRWGARRRRDERLRPRPRRECRRAAPLLTSPAMDFRTESLADLSRKVRAKELSARDLTTHALFAHRGGESGDQCVRGPRRGPSDGRGEGDRRSHRAR